ncbi:MAG: hypothetical protein J7539_02560 [Niabella sp.]|nr:hypothetical protein [Niabella sp.]
MKTLLFIFLSCFSLQSMAQHSSLNSRRGISMFKFTAPDSSFRSVKPLSLNTVYYDRLGFMCRQEVKMEKITKTSLRFRLGSVGYTDRMEGKLNAVAAP